MNKTLLALTGIAAFTVPVFSSGLRRELTFARWLWNHTVFGDFPLYLPKEIVLSSEDLYELPQAQEEVPELIPVELPPIGEIYYVAKKRFGEETHDLREWITPYAAKVVEYASELYDADRDTFILACWTWVCKSFDWTAYDNFKLKAFIKPYDTWGVYRQADFWEMPGETIAFYEDGLARGKRPRIDCEGTAFLLASLLLSQGVQAYANIGYFNSWGHAWCSVVRDGKEYLLETTLSDEWVDALLATNPWISVASVTEFRPLYKFNHQTVMDLTGT